MVWTPQYFFGCSHREVFLLWLPEDYFPPTPITRQPGWECSSGFCCVVLWVGITCSLCLGLDGKTHRRHQVWEWSRVVEACGATGVAHQHLRGWNCHVASDQAACYCSHVAAPQHTSTGSIWAGCVAILIRCVFGRLQQLLQRPGSSP